MQYLFWVWPIAIVGFLVNCFVSVIPYYVLATLGMKKVANNWLYFNGRLLSKLIFVLCGLRIQKTISPKTQLLLKKNQAVCFVSNHTSMLDIPAVVYATKAQTGFIAKAVLKKIPVFNLLAMAMKCVFIDRSSRKDSINGIEKGENTIKNNHSMLIFPEGTRSKTGEIAPFKPGSFRLATETDTPIVPVTIKGFREALEGRKKVFGLYNAQVAVGDPVHISSGEDREVRFDKIKQVEDSIRETYASLGDK